MDFDCDLIRDLLPLYLDGVCSDASRRAVKAHLAGCADCRRALAETGDWAKNRRREHGAAAAWSARADEVTRILGTTGLY